MSRDVTVHDNSPDTLALLKKLSKNSNPRQAARNALRVGVELLAKDTAKAPLPKPPAKKKAAKKKASKVKAGADLDLTAEATPEKF